MCVHIICLHVPTINGWSGDITTFLHVWVLPANISHQSQLSPLIQTVRKCYNPLSHRYSGMRVKLGGGGGGCLLTLCLTCMIECGEHVTFNCKLQSCRSLNDHRKKKIIFLKKKTKTFSNAMAEILVDSLCFKGHVLEHTCAHMSTQKTTVLHLVTLVLYFTLSFILRQGDQAPSMQFKGHSPCYICCWAGSRVWPHVWRDQGGAQEEG